MVPVRALFSALARGLRQADPCSSRRRIISGNSDATSRIYMHPQPPLSRQAVSLALPCSLSSYAARGTDRPPLVVSSFRVASVILGLFLSFFICFFFFPQHHKPPCQDAGSAAAGSWATERALPRPLRLCLEHPVPLLRPRAPFPWPLLPYRRLPAGAWPT